MPPPCGRLRLWQGSARRSGDGIVRLHRETKGRGGKAVTLIKGLDLPEAELRALARP